MIKEHLNPVLSLDWHPVTKSLITCSTDRGLLVWNYHADANEYKPKLGALKEPFANTDASWNTAGDKFVCGAASGRVFIGTFSKINDLWIAQPLKKVLHKASVTCVKFDPMCGRVIASASTDGQVLLTTCYDKDVDGAATAAGPFGGVTTFGDTLLSFNSIGWVNFVAFSPSASTICYGSKFKIITHFSS